MATKTDLINAVLNQLRSALGTGEDPDGSNHNFITVWYNQNVDPIGDGPWCEMTNTWAMWTGGAKDLKKGRAYTVWAAEDAQNGVNGSFWHYGLDGIQPGDQYYLDWGGEKGDLEKVDHTGTVEKVNDDGTFYGLEGNLGNKLVRVHRDSTYVVGYVRFDWDHLVSVVTSPSPSPAPIPTPPAAPQGLDIDGELGPKTISRWQSIMGTPVDGVISTPSQLVEAVQYKLKVLVTHTLATDGVGIYQDGNPYHTVAALQSYLRSPVDGILSTPVSECVKALQRRLNEGWF
jgi:hypothetical protein